MCSGQLSLLPFAHAYVWKINDFTWYLPQRLTECPNFYYICPKKTSQNPGFFLDICPKTPEFYMTIMPEKYFSRFFFWGGGGVGGSTCFPWPPVSYAYVDAWVSISAHLESGPCHITTGCSRMWPSFTCECNINYCVHFIITENSTCWSVTQL